MTKSTKACATKRVLSGLAIVGVAFVATLGFTMKSQQIKELCAGFLPANNMYIPVDSRTAGGISEKQFNQVMDRLQSIFTADIEAAGDKLQINRLWTDGTVNASAQRSGNTRILNMYGGLARHKAIGVEGMALVVCHELGHHNGGAPKIDSWMGNSWATNEGGADYYATSKCLRRFFAQDDNAKIIAGLTIDPTAKTSCESQFSNLQDQLLCLRISEAGQQVANLFMDLRKQTTPPKFSTPDMSEVSSTNDDHPDTQCRLDTYFAGSLCQVRETEVPSDTDYKVASCYTPRDAVGFRPRCWFAPN